MSVRDLPAEYEARWIAELVRSFVFAREHDDDDLLADYAQEAFAAAARALRKADADGIAGPRRTAYVKRAVRSCLTDLNRRADRRAGVVTSAEDLPRDEDDDGSVRLVEERFEDSAFDRLPRRLTNDIHVALMLLDPRIRRIWRAFRDTGGSSREMAAYLGGVSHFTVQKRLLPALFATFARALGAVRTLRGKTL